MCCVFLHFFFFTAPNFWPLDFSFTEKLMAAHLLQNTQDFCSLPFLLFSLKAFKSCSAFSRINNRFSAKLGPPLMLLPTWQENKCVHLMQKGSFAAVDIQPRSAARKCDVTQVYFKERFPFINILVHLRLGFAIGKIHIMPPLLIYIDHLINFSLFFLATSNRILAHNSSFRLTQPVQLSGFKCLLKQAPRRLIRLEWNRTHLNPLIKWF